MSRPTHAMLRAAAVASCLAVGGCSGDGGVKDPEPGDSGSTADSGEASDTGTSLPSAWKSFDGHPRQWCGLTVEGELWCAGADPPTCTTIDPALLDGTDWTSVQVPIHNSEAGLPPLPGAEGSRLRVISDEHGTSWAWGAGWCEPSVFVHGGVVPLIEEGGHSDAGDMVVTSAASGRITSAFGSCIGSANLVSLNATWWNREILDWAAPRSTSSDSTAVCTILEDGTLTCGGLTENATLFQDDEAWWEGDWTHHEGDWYQSASGVLYTCALDAKGIATCWWQFGSPETTPSGTHVPESFYPPDLTPPTTAFVDLVAGPRHVCGLTAAGAVECWGDDEQLASLTHPGPFSHISPWCGLTTDGAIACWSKEELATQRCELVCNEDGCT